MSNIRTKNEGRVKINGSGGVTPQYSLSAGIEQIIDYGVAALDLSSSPTNEWPQNIDSPTDSDIWDSVNTTLIENPILGQSHIWRILYDYSNKQLNAAGEFDVFLRNTLSGFEAHYITTLPEGQTAGSGVEAIIITIADGASIPAPVGAGQGYELVFNSAVDIDIDVKSVTRFSLFHESRVEL